MRLWFLPLALCAYAVPLAAAEPAPVAWKAGVAVRVITPEGPQWMAGYGNRNKPSEGKLTELYVKALALEDPKGGRLVLLTSDLVGVPRSLSVAVAEEVRKRTGLPRERLMLTVSHTHCGPVLRDSLSDMYDMPAELAAKVGPYTNQVRDRMVEVIVRALADLKPAALAVGRGTARFAVNRRKPTARGVVNDANPAGPVDHDVPVLRVTAPDGKLRAVVFGYACHNTTLQFYRWCGDYAGFAQRYLEEKHPGAAALFWTGCGADANPLPRGKVEQCEKYGRELADAVEAVLSGTLTVVRGDGAARYAEIALPFDKLPGKEKWAADLLSKQYAVRKRAERYSKQLREGAKIDDHYGHYPVQVWRLGEQVTWVALGGEVVVDYGLRLKKELRGGPAVWVTGYANDVMAYVASKRVLAEGGYEADSSMIYYGQPTNWAPEVEEKIVGKARELVKEVGGK
ncbi:MAG TPA: neutral/alkaline non-lysosomal ceramidase N-terminal domain-containing protein [Gemmataceae bacterium]|nr:neutral/alkaline non-lysosomal ceramidase N-terminal domain-containing protein [Gemmataceae bacterium]